MNVLGMEALFSHSHYFFNQLRFSNRKDVYDDYKNRYI